MWLDSELNVVRWYIVHLRTASYIGCGWTVNSMLSSGTLCKLHRMWLDSELSVVLWYIVHVLTASYSRCGGTVDT